MKLENRSKQILILSATFILVILATTAILQATAVTANEDPNLITIVGGSHLKINRYVSEDFRFSPGTIHVKHGASITLINLSGEGHTFTLVAASLRPTTFQGVLGCGMGSPFTDICTATFVAHAPPGAPAYCTFAPVGAPPGFPPACQYLENGLPSSTPPDLDTIFTLSSAGDSVLINPGQVITMKVTAPAGTILAFFCAAHSWMQGQIVVDQAD